MGHMYAIVNDDYLAHHGVKGQKWGVRRYQNADGSYTDEGQAHYGQSNGRKGLSKAAKIGLGVAGAAALAGGAYAFSRSKAGRKLIANGVNRFNGAASAMDGKLSAARAQRLMNKGALGVKNNGQKFFDAADNVTSKFNAREMARAKSLAKVGAAANDPRSMGQFIKSDFSNLGTGAKNVYSKAGAKFNGAAEGLRSRMSSAKDKFAASKFGTGAKNAYDRAGAKIYDATEGLRSGMASAKDKFTASKNGFKDLRDYSKLEGIDAGSRLKEASAKIGGAMADAKGKFNASKAGQAFKTARDNVSAYATGTKNKFNASKVGQGLGTYKDSLTKDIGILRDTGSVVGKQIKKFPGQAKEYGVRRASNVLKTTTGNMVGSRMKNISKAGKITAAVGAGLGTVGTVGTGAYLYNRRKQAQNR